jgi:hypothetical protein
MLVGDKEPDRIDGIRLNELAWTVGGRESISEAAGDGILMTESARACGG